jgi:hypothetical protein
MVIGHGDVVLVTWVGATAEQSHNPPGTRRRTSHIGICCNFQLVFRSAVQGNGWFLLDSSLCLVSCKRDSIDFWPHSTPHFYIILFGDPYSQDTGLTFQSLLVTGCTNKLNILTTVPSNHTVFMCFVFVWKQTATCAFYIKHWLVFITEMKSVYSAVRTEPLNVAVCPPSFKG